MGRTSNFPADAAVSIRDAADDAGRGLDNCRAGRLMLLLATVCAALYLSSRCRNVQAAIIGSIVLCMLPTIIYMVSSSNVADILRCIFPSGGIGLTNSFFYD